MILNLHTTAIQHISEMEFLSKVVRHQIRQTKVRPSRLRLRGVDQVEVDRVVLQVVQGRPVAREETSPHMITHPMVLTIN